MARDIDPDNSEVRNLIVNTLKAEERASMESDRDESDCSEDESRRTGDSEGEYDGTGGGNSTFDVGQTRPDFASEHSHIEQLQIMQVGDFIIWRVTAPNFEHF